MTSNQIAYWTLEETRKANAATQGETKRHNKAVEDYNIASLGEVARHNVATENIDLGKLQESNRHNLVSENQSQQSINETIRHNQNVEYETGRHNIASENISWATLDNAKLRTQYQNMLDDAKMWDIYTTNPLAYAASSIDNIYTAANNTERTWIPNLNPRDYNREGLHNNVTHRNTRQNSNRGNGNIQNLRASSNWYPFYTIQSDLGTIKEQFISN